MGKCLHVVADIAFPQSGKKTAVSDVNVSEAVSALSDDMSGWMIGDHANIVLKTEVMALLAGGGLTPSRKTISWRRPPSS